MISLLRKLLLVLAVTAGVSYLYFFFRWNDELLGKSIHLVLWSYRRDVAVDVDPFLLFVLAVSGVATLAYTLGFVPSWMSRGRAHRGVRREQAAIAQLESGLDLMARKDLVGARKALGQVLSNDVTHTESHLALAELYRNDGNRLKALELLEEEREANPGNVRISLAKARVLADDGRPAEAATELRRALRESGPSVGLLEALRDLMIREESWEEAYANQQHLVRLLREARSGALEREAERLTFLRYEVARVRQQNGKADDAMATLKDLLKRNPKFAPAAVTLGDAYVARGQGAEAVKLWEKSFRADPQLVFLDRLEALCLEQGDPERVLRLYRETLQREPRNLVLRFMYGKLCLKLEMIDEALEQFEQVESSGAQFPELAVLKGEANHRRKNLDAAVQEFRKAVRVDGLRYVCRSCGATTYRWEARCASCHEWDTLRSAARLEIESHARPAELGPLITV